MVYSDGHLYKLYLSSEIGFLLFIVVRKMDRITRFSYEKIEEEKIEILKVDIFNIIKTISDLVNTFKTNSLIMEPILKSNIQLLLGDLKSEKYYIGDLKPEVENIEKLLGEINAGTK